MAQQTSSYQLYKGVIVDTNSKNIYNTNPKTGIDARSVQNGSLSWHSDKAELPIMVNDSQLIAQQSSTSKGMLGLAQFNSTTGKLLVEKSLMMPNQIIPNIKDGLNQKFNVYENKGTLGSIRWNYFSQSSQGMLEKETPNIKENYGEIVLGQNKQLDGAQLVSFSQKPTRSVGHVEGKFLSGIDGRQFKSVTGDHILVSGINKDATIWDKYSWDFYDLKGTQLGHMDFAHSFRPFILIDDLILFVNTPFEKATETTIQSFPLSLNAYSLSSGDLVWNTEVRDFSFTGAFPQ